MKFEEENDFSRSAELSLVPSSPTVLENIARSLKKIVNENEMKLNNLRCSQKLKLKPDFH